VHYVKLIGKYLPTFRIALLNSVFRIKVEAALLDTVLMMKTSSSFEAFQINAN